LCLHSSYCIPGMERILMNKNSILYWSLTGLVSAFMVFSAVMYLTAEQMAAAFRHLGFPDYFRVELAIAKLIGAQCCCFPFRPALRNGLMPVSGLLSCRRS